MSDPLAIASGIAGLLSLGIQVTQSLVGFYTTFKDQDTDVSKLKQNLAHLQATFRSLDVAVQDRQSHPDSQELLREVEKAAQRCGVIIQELRTECKRFQNDLVTDTGLKGRILVTGRRVAYPFRKSTLQKLEEDIGEIRDNLSFALDVLQIKNDSRIQDGVSEVKALVEQTNASQVSFTIRDWLMAPDASLNHNAACEKSHTSTGLWFVKGNQFRTWLEEPSSFLWLHGFAGCGKTVLCSTAIQNTFHRTRDEPGVGIAFFYFSFNDRMKQDVNGLLRALLLQLSTQLPDGGKHLEQLHTVYRYSSPPVQVLLDSLKHLLIRFNKCYLLLDALDESPRDRSREGVLGAIQQIRSWSISSIHLLVTSRNEIDIHESLQPSQAEDLSMRNSGTNLDIENFVSYQLSNEPKFQKWKTRHQEIQKALTTRAQGV